MKTLEWVSSGDVVVCRVRGNPTTWRLATMFRPGTLARLSGSLDREQVHSYVVEFYGMPIRLKTFDTEQEARTFVESIYALEYS